MPNYKEIARLKVAGQSNRTVADSLGISRNTVNYYGKNGFSKHKFSHDDLRWFLISSFDVSSLNYLKDQIGSLIK